MDVIRGRHEYKSVFNFVLCRSRPIQPRGAFKHDLWIALHKLTHYFVSVGYLCLRNFIVAHEKLNHNLISIGQGGAFASPNLFQENV